MRASQIAILAGSAVFALALSGSAFAQSTQTHVMNVRLPGGGVEQIRYTGNVAPRIVVTNAPMGIADVVPLPSVFGGDPAFAMMQRISADMDRQAAAMFRQIDAMTAAAARARQLSPAAIRDVPGGSDSYTYVSTMTGKGVCSRSVEITSSGNGAPPRVVSHTSGDCGSTAPGATSGPVNAATMPTPTRAVPMPAPINRPDLLWTSADGPSAYGGMVRKVADARR